MAKWRCEMHEMVHAALRSCFFAAVLALCVDLTAICAPDHIILSPAPGHVYLDPNVNVVVLGLPEGRLSLLVSLNFNEAIANFDFQSEGGGSPLTFLLPAMLPGSYVIHVAVLQRETDSLSEAFESFFTIAAPGHDPRSEEVAGAGEAARLSPLAGDFVVAEPPVIALTGGARIRLLVPGGRPDGDDDGDGGGGEGPGEGGAAGEDGGAVVRVRVAVWHCGIPGDETFGAEWMEPGAQ
ncbi:hypothetical protein T484DRAFT_1778423, partial [Baffinella frigidus]